MASLVKQEQLRTPLPLRAQLKVASGGFSPMSDRDTVRETVGPDSHRDPEAWCSERGHYRPERPRPGVSDGDITGPNDRSLVFPDGDITGQNARGLVLTEGAVTGPTGRGLVFRTGTLQARTAEAWCSRTGTLQDRTAEAL